MCLFIQILSLVLISVSVRWNLTIKFVPSDLHTDLHTIFTSTDTLKLILSSNVIGLTYTDIKSPDVIKTKGITTTKERAYFILINTKSFFKVGLFYYPRLLVYCKSIIQIAIHIGLTLQFFRLQQLLFNPILCRNKV